MLMQVARQEAAAAPPRGAARGPQGGVAPGGIRRTGTQRSDTSTEDEEFYLSDNSGSEAEQGGHGRGGPNAVGEFDLDQLDHESARQIAALFGGLSHRGPSLTLADAVNAARIGASERDGNGGFASEQGRRRHGGQFDSPRRAAPFGADMGVGATAGSGYSNFDASTAEELVMSDVDSDAGAATKNLDGIPWRACPPSADSRLSAMPMR